MRQATRPTSHAATLLVGGTGHAPRAVYLWILFLTAILVWSHLTPVDVFVRAPGMVRPDGDVIRITSETAGRVEVLNALEGDTVHPGDALVHLNDADQRTRRQTLVQQIDVRDTQIAHVRSRLEAIRLIHVADQRRLEAEITATRERLARQASELEARLEAAAVGLAQARSSHETATALFEEGLISREDWARSLTELRLSELDYTRTSTESPDWSAIALLERARDVATTQFAADQEDLSSSMYPIRAQLSELREDLSYVIAEQARHTIRSPAHGQLTLLENIHPGEYLAAGALVGTLEPAGSTRVVEAILANRDAEDVHVAQPVKLLIDESQVVNGTVRSISPDVRRGEAAGGTFRVIVLPEQEDLRLGLAMEVRFLTETETVLSLLLGRIAEAFRELGG